MTNSLNILIAPLDWGMGHTTRCIPIIKYLQEKGHKVFVASSGIYAQLLKENIQNIDIIPLEGYNIKYSHSKYWFSLKIIVQIPKILNKIKNENTWLSKIVIDYKIDAIIADNRYGLHHPKIKNAILTHQVQILSGKGAFVDRILLKIHKKILEKYDHCWIVDQKANPNLAGILSHPAKLPKNAYYFGFLSQFQTENSNTLSTNKEHILILLSGPEPMRSQLEQLLWQQITTLTLFKFVFVCGHPKSTVPASVPNHVEWHSHLPAKTLLPKLLQAQMVVCRSGYSTLMDLQLLQIPAILIPTPGQTEQEYLAHYLNQNFDNYIYVPQEKVDLNKDIAKLIYSKKTTKSRLNKQEYQLTLDNWLKT